MLSINETNESAIPSDTVANDIDATGADALGAPIATAPKSKSGAPISREEVGKLLHDNPESAAAEIEKATENLSPGTRGGFNSETREAIRTAKRVMVKIGSSSLTKSDDRTDLERIDFIADTLEKCMGISDVIVVSSGAVASEMGPLGLTSRPFDSATKQATAAMGQVHLTQEWGRSFLRYSRTSAQMLLTSGNVGVRSRARSAQRTTDRLRQLGAISIVNESDTIAASEFRFGDNDRLATLVSHLAYCDALILLSGVGGLYDRDPVDPDATFVSEVRSSNDLRDVVTGDDDALGTGRMASKVPVARLASHAGVPMLLTSAPSIERALNRADVGTAFSTKENRLSARKFQMLYAADSLGLLRLGAGTVDTVTCMRKSLLPAGITVVCDEFSAGDIVDLTGPSNEVIGRSEVNCDSEKLLGTIGYHTEELPNGTQKPVVHADYLSGFASRAQRGIVLRAAALKDAHTWVRPDRDVSAKSSWVWTDWGRSD